MTERRAVEVGKVVRLIVEALVDDAKHVTIMTIESERGVHFRITASAEQVGKLIGKEGRGARAIRTILGLLSEKNKALYTVRIEPRHPS